MHRQRTEDLSSQSQETKRRIWNILVFGLGIVDGDLIDLISANGDNVAVHNVYPFGILKERHAFEPRNSA
jgi:hypothetical protein